MRYLISAALVFALSTPLLACINYPESANHEREFKSQYQESQYQPPQPETMSSTTSFVLVGTGVTLAVAGAGLYLRLRSNER